MDAIAVKCNIPSVFLHSLFLFFISWPGFLVTGGLWWHHSGKDEQD